MPEAHAVYSPDSHDQHQQISERYWHCYLCPTGSRSLDAAERHFIREHPVQWLAWYLETQRRITTAVKVLTQRKTGT